MQRYVPATPNIRIALFIVALWFAALGFTYPNKGGDFQEYALMTIALSNHGSPDIRPQDIAVAERLSPDAGSIEIYRRLRAGIAVGDKWPYPGFVDSKRGGHHAMHFFAYSALAAIPFKGAHGWRPAICTLAPLRVKRHIRTEHSKGRAWASP